MAVDSNCRELSSDLELELDPEPVGVQLCMCACVHKYPSYGVCIMYHRLYPPTDHGRSRIQVLSELAGWPPSTVPVPTQVSGSGHNLGAAAGRPAVLSLTPVWSYLVLPGAL